MKSPNVYVGQYHDIRHGAVYTSIDEAVKEVRRVLQPGLMIMFTNLPDSPTGKYWIAGTVGQSFDPRFNLIFCDSLAAEKHMDTISKRGFPQRDLVCKELKLNTVGPVTPDIKTEEHYQAEAELAGIKEALSRGLMANNSENMMTIEPEYDAGDVATGVRPSWNLLTNHDQYAVIDLSAHPLALLDDANIVLNQLSQTRKLLLEIASVDPETQPRKWARLQTLATQLAANITTPYEAAIDEDELTVEAGAEPAQDPVGDFRVVYHDDQGNLLLDTNFSHQFAYEVGDPVHIKGLEEHDPIRQFTVVSHEMETSTDTYKVVVTPV